jgi:hypothetical protein
MGIRLIDIEEVEGPSPARSTGIPVLEGVIIVTGSTVVNITFGVQALPYGVIDTLGKYSIIVPPMFDYCPLTPSI